MARRWSRKSTPTAFQTRAESITPGKSDFFQLCVEEALLPALHGTLVKAGGHLVQKEQRMRGPGRHKHEITQHHKDC